MKNADKLALILCVGTPEKGAKSSNVKEYAESGLNTLQQGVILRAYPVTTVLGWAFTLTHRCVGRARGPRCLAMEGAYSR